MDPTQYHQPEYSNSTYGDLGPLQLHMANFSEQYESFDQYPQHPVPPATYFLGTHPVQHTTLYGPTGGLPMRSHSHQIPVVRLSYLSRPSTKEDITARCSWSAP